MNYLKQFQLFVVPIILIVVSLFFIFHKVETGKKIEDLEKSISESKARISMYEAQVLSHASKTAEYQAIISNKDSLIADLDTEINELELSYEFEYVAIDDLKPDQYQGEIDKYYNPKSDVAVADLDESQAVSVINTAIENDMLRKQNSLLKLQRIELSNTIVARDGVIESQKIQIGLLNDQISEYKNIEVLDNKKYKVLFKKYRRQKWLVRGVAAIGVAAVILLN